MGKKILLRIAVLLVLSMFTTPIVFAQSQPTQQFNKIFLDPFYRQSMNGNTPYSYNLYVYSPDKIKSVSSAIASFDVYLNDKDITFDLKVNNQSCNNPTYVILKDMSGEGMQEIKFDCSNVIKKEGNYNFVLTPNDYTGTITGWVDLTYSNNPRGLLTLHGTEYLSGENAKIWLQLLDNNGTDITDGVCYVDIYTPSNEEYVIGATMTNMQHEGLYSYDLIAPQSQGVYPAIAKCYYEAIQDFEYADSFDLLWGQSPEDTYLLTYVLDGNEHKYKELTDASGMRRLNFSYTFNNMCGLNVSEDLLTGITVTLNAKWVSVTNDDIHIFVYNFTSSNWIELDNHIHSPNDRITVTNSINTNNLTTSGLVNSSGSLILFFNDTYITDGADTKIEMDYLSVSCDQLANPEWQEAKGSSEMHISSNIPYSIDYEETGSYNVTNTTIITLQNGTTINRSYYTGIFTHQFTIASGTSTPLEDVLIEYQGLHSIPCNSVLDLYFINDTGYYIHPYTLQRQTDEDHCSINFYINLSSHENYKFETHARNTWESDMRSISSAINTIYPVIDGTCETWRISNDFPHYEIPLTSVADQYGEIYRACANWHDDYYQFNVLYNQSLEDKQLIIDEQSYLQYEADFFSLQFAQNKLNILSSWGLQFIISQPVTAENEINVYTLCGDWRNKPLTSYACAEIKEPDEVFDSQEGYILENLTILNLYNTTYSTNFNYNTATGVDCSSIFQVIKDNGTRIDITDEIIYSVGSSDNCQMSIPIEYTQGQSQYQIEIYMENYILWDIQWARDRVNFWNDTIVPFCENISTNRNISYNIPINASLEQYRNDTELYFCYRAMDNIYWWYYFYDDMIASNLTQIGDSESYHYESEFFWTLILDDYNTIQTYNRNLNQIQTLADILELRNTVAERIWNYTNRNLTYYEDTTNYTRIQQDVWSYTDTIVAGLLNQIAIAVWTYESRNITSVINLTAISDAVWTRTDRNLTYYESTDEVDYNRIYEGVWNNTYRNLTYYEVANVTNLTVNVDNDALASAVWNYQGDISSSVILQFIDDIDCLFKTYFYDQEGWGVDIPVCN